MKLLVSTAIALSASLWAAGCEDLLNLKLADTTIKSAESIPAGDLTTADKAVRKNMPAFCRIVASVTDAPDSDIRIEMWLPNEGWKGVFHAIGKAVTRASSITITTRWRPPSSEDTPPQ